MVVRIGIAVTSRNNIFIHQRIGYGAILAKKQVYGSIVGCIGECRDFWQTVSGSLAQPVVGVERATTSGRHTNEWTMASSARLVYLLLFGVDSS